MTGKLAWHFVGDALRDGSPIPRDGEWLEHKGKCEICVSGLHASYRIIDALQYAPAETICRVRVDAIAHEQDDKLVCSRRNIIWRIDGTNVLREFARKQALGVAHLWDMPQVVRRYLETGDESISDAAWAAARAAASDAARDAAWAAARAAAWAAARDAASDAANTQLTQMVMAAHKRDTP